MEVPKKSKHILSRLQPNPSLSTLLAPYLLPELAVIVVAYAGDADFNNSVRDVQNWFVEGVASKDPYENFHQPLVAKDESQQLAEMHDLFYPGPRYAGLIISQVASDQAALDQYQGVHFYQYAWQHGLQKTAFATEDVANLYDYKDQTIFDRFFAALIEVYGLVGIQSVITEMYKRADPSRDPTLHFVQAFHAFYMSKNPTACACKTKRQRADTNAQKHKKQK